MDRDVEMDDMRVGTAPWVQRTAGRLTEAERRALLWPLARSHAQNAVGRLRFAVGLHPGRHATVLPARLAPPATVLTGAAEECAKRVLPVSLLNHSYRTYVFGRALGELVLGRHAELALAPRAIDEDFDIGAVAGLRHMELGHGRTVTVAGDGDREGPGDEALAKRSLECLGAYGRDAVVAGLIDGYSALRPFLVEGAA